MIFETEFTSAVFCLLVADPVRTLWSGISLVGGLKSSLPIIILPTSIVLAVDEDQDYFEETLFCVPIGVYVK